MEQQRNIIIAVVLSLAILVGFQYFMPKAKTPPAPVQTAENQAGSPARADQNNASAPSSGGASEPATPEEREKALAGIPRLKIDTPRLQGSISLQGARLDDLTLPNYREEPTPGSPAIQLLSPDGTVEPYFVDYGWVAGAEGVKLPDPKTLWQTSDTALTQDHPVTLTWDNGQGLRFTRHYAVDADFMFTVTENVENKGDKAVTLYPYGLISRGGTPPTSPSYLLHVGPVGVINGTLHDGGFFLAHDNWAYDAVKKGPPVADTTTGGWLGFTDKYWLAALIPMQGEAVKTRLSFNQTDRGGLYQADYTGSAHEIAPGANVSVTQRLFAGAKEVHLLDRYESDLGIPHFDKAIDFGWFYWITKPIFLALDFIYQHIGNFGLSIILLTICIKALFFPLANRSYRAMSKMKLLQPEMAKLREKFGEDKARLNQEMMALYKRGGANPAAGCLPVVIQIPVFFSLYKVLYVTIEMRQAPFYGWIHDLSVPDPTSFINLFGLLPFPAPHISFLMIGLWPLIMGITMFLQQRLSPQPPDPMQAKMFMILPVVFTFMLSQFPAGLVIYWACNNTLTIAQQWFIMRRAGVGRTPALAK